MLALSAENSDYATFQEVLSPRSTSLVKGMSEDQLGVSGCMEKSMSQWAERTNQIRVVGQLFELYLCPQIKLNIMSHGVKLSNI